MKPINAIMTHLTVCVQQQQVFLCKLLLRLTHTSCFHHSISFKVQLRLCGCGCRRWAADWPAFMREWGWHHGLALWAGMAILPRPSAPGAEDGVAGRAWCSGGLALSARLQVAHRLTFKHRAPGFAGVQLHSCRKHSTICNAIDLTGGSSRNTVFHDPA